MLRPGDGVCAVKRLALVGCLMAPLGCGPEITPPGAKGQISLLPGQDASAYSTLEIRMYEDTGEFDLAEMVKAGNKAEKRLELSELPVDYELVLEQDDGETGSDNSDWRVTAWLSTTDEADAPVVRDLLGSEPFKLADCSAPVGGSEVFCGTTKNVDVLINSILQGQ
jgi:hypothetical protein